MPGRPGRQARRLAEQAAALAPATPPTYPPHTTAPDYSDALIPELLALASEGYAAVEIAAHLCISEETLKAWGEAHASFGAALTDARTREKAWWMSRPRLALRDDNNRFPAGAWSHVMRARWEEYGDQQGVTVNVDLGRLVVLDLRGPELMNSQQGSEASALIEGQVVRLDTSLTGEGGVESAPDPVGAQGEPPA